MVLWSIPKAVDFADVTGGDECLDVPVPHHVHQVAEFVLGKQGLDFDIHIPAVTSFHLVHTAPAVERLHYVLSYQLMVFADDTDPFALVQAGREIIKDESVQPGTYKTRHDNTEWIDGEGRTADDGAGHRNRPSNIEMQVFIE